jgi:hypothetical protein
LADLFKTILFRPGKLNPDARSKRRYSMPISAGEFSREKFSEKKPRRSAQLAIAASLLLTFAGFRVSVSETLESAATERIAKSQPAKAETMTTVESQTIAVRINRPFQSVYDFLAIPENWNQWATGLGKSIKHTKDGWVAGTQNGPIKVRFTPPNNFGVVDHYVVRSSGAEIYVPMRLITNNTGCELQFTLFREPNMSDETYASDAGWVQKDLNTLKSLLEK